MGLYIQKVIALPTPSSATARKPIMLVYSELSPFTSFPIYLIKNLLTSIAPTRSIALNATETITFRRPFFLSIIIIFLTVV